MSRLSTARVFVVIHDRFYDPRPRLHRTGACVTRFLQDARLTHAEIALHSMVVQAGERCYSCGQEFGP